MPRTVNAATIAELANDDLKLATLLIMYFDTPIIITDHPRDITYFVTYLSSPHILDVSVVNESTEPQVGTCSIQLSAVEQTYVALLLNNDWMDIRVTYQKAFLDSDDNVIGDPILFFDGNINTFKIVDRGPSSKVIIDCASHWANWNVISGRKTNMVSQQSHFPTDLGMQYAAHSVRSIRWGPDAPNRSGYEEPSILQEYFRNRRILGGIGLGGF